jgi:hypothetical protein
MARENPSATRATIGFTELAEEEHIPARASCACWGPRVTRVQTTSSKCQRSAAPGRLALSRQGHSRISTNDGHRRRNSRLVEDVRIRSLIASGVLKAVWHFFEAWDDTLRLGPIAQTVKKRNMRLLRERGSPHG